MAKLRRCEPRAANSHIPHHVEEANLQQENEVNMQRKQTRQWQENFDGIQFSGSRPWDPKLFLFFFSKFSCNNPFISGRHPRFYSTVLIFLKQAQVKFLPFATEESWQHRDNFSNIRVNAWYLVGNWKTVGREEREGRNGGGIGIGSGSGKEGTKKRYYDIHRK